MPPSSPFSRIKSGFHPLAMVKYHRNYRKACTGLGRKFHDQNTVRMSRQNIYQTPKGLILQGFREDSKRIYYQFTTSKTTMICLHTIEN